MKKWCIYYINLLLLLLLYCSPTVAQQLDKLNSTEAVFNLRSQSFQGSIALNGKWFFYWNELLQPNAVPKQKPVLVDFPFKWNGFHLSQQTLPAKGYATFSATVILPSKHTKLSIGVPDMYCAYRLFINGELYSSNGVVDTLANNFKAYWEYKIQDLPTNTDTLQLLLQIANFDHSKGGISKEIIIGETETILLNRKKTEAIDLLLTGCLLMGGLFFLGLFFLGNRDKAILLFSLYSIVFSYRIIGTDNYVLHTLIPNLNWYFTTRIEYLTLFLGLGLFFQYTRKLYPKDAGHNVLKSIIFLCYILATGTIILPIYWVTLLLLPFLVIMFFCLLYIPIIYVQAYRKKRPGAMYALASALVYMVICFISLFHYLDLLPALQLLSFICYISFFFLQSLILSHRVSFTLQKAKQDAEQGLKAKTEFLSTMSHEIRTPLNSVVGMSHILLKTQPRQDQQQHLEVLLFSANNLLSIVNDILDFSKIEAGKISFESIETDIRYIVKNITGGLNSEAEKKRIQLISNVDERLQQKVLTDSTRLTQVLNNLVHNAIKFTEKGTVKISVELVNQSKNTIELRFSVQDTGIGIAIDKQKLIFEQFTQADSSTSRSFGGTGLGLTICKRILELQGSILKLESEVGVGSRFYFEQTFTTGTTETAVTQQLTTALPKEEDKPLTGIHILLAEDNLMNVLVARTFLERWGAVITVAHNGAEALVLLEQPIAYKLILMDMHMPIMDGYTATKKIREKGIQIPIIALTASLPKDVENQIIETGINDIVVKPFEPDELYRKVLFYIFQ